MAKQDDRRRAVSWFTVSWFAWWALMMSLWVAADDSLRSDELIVGAVAAALAAAAAVGVGRLAQVRAGFKAAWLSTAVGGVLGLPGRVVQETFAVFAALARTLVRGEAPRGGFREIPGETVIALVFMVAVSPFLSHATLRAIRARSGDDGGDSVLQLTPDEPGTGDRG